MGSLTQAVLGATIAGTTLGTLPNRNVAIPYGDAVKNFTFHRGFSHSLFVRVPFSLALWAMLSRSWQD